ncbi:MAG: methionine--tRNA ligase, partial [Chloroflexota bacterium]
EGPLFGEQYTETITDNLGDHEVLRYNPANASGTWEPSQLPAGQNLRKPAPLFRKLEDEIVASERARLGQV